MQSKEIAFAAQGLGLAAIGVQITIGSLSKGADIVDEKVSPSDPLLRVGHGVELLQRRAIDADTHQCINPLGAQPVAGLGADRLHHGETPLWIWGAIQSKISA